MHGRNAERAAAYGDRLARPSGLGLSHRVESLARTLTDDERKALLDRIHKSLSIEEGGRRKIIHSELRQERRMELVRADLESLGFWDRLRLWMRRMINHRSDYDLFIAFRLEQSRDRAKERAPEIFDFEHRDFLPGMAAAVRPLCQLAQPILPFFRMLWNSEDALRKVIDFLLSKRVPDARVNLNQFCSTREMQDEFRRTESQNRIKQVVLERLGAYIDGIPDSVLEEIETGLQPLYLYRDVVLFDYDEFFSLFQSSRNEAIGEGELHLRPVSGHRGIDKVEELYLALHYSSRVSGEPQVYQEMIQYYLAVRHETLDESGIPTDEHTEDVARLRGAILAFSREVERLRKALPLAQVIRFYRSDPYYRFIAYTPKLRLRDFYYANLKMKILDELDRRFNDIRMGALGQMVQEVFPRGLVQFEYFHTEIQSSIKRAGVGTLQVYRPLQVVNTFIKQVYRTGLMEFMRIIGRIIPARSRQSRTDLTLYIAGLDDVAERLRVFDMSFSPDSDEGKTFFRYRFSTSERDKTMISAYKALVAQKDRDAKGVIEKFLDQIQGVATAFEIIGRGNTQGINERYQSFESTLAEERPFDQRLKQYQTALESTQKIVKQMIAVENEG